MELLWAVWGQFRSCFVEVAQHSNDLLMNLWGRKWSPCPILHHLGTAPLPPPGLFISLITDMAGNTPISQSLPMVGNLTNI